MPRARSTIRKRYIDGVTNVLDWQLEEELVFGCVQALDPSFNRLQHINEWQHEWDQWRDTILPKALEARPGTRPFAMYAVGEIPPRPTRAEIPRNRRFDTVSVRQLDGSNVTHYLNAPSVYVKPEIDHLVDLGIVDGDELERFRVWQLEANSECDKCPVDRYYLETALHE